MSDIVKSIKDLQLTASGIDYFSFDFKNHDEVVKYFNSFPAYNKPQNQNLYNNIRSHLKIFCTWMHYNNMNPGTWMVTSYKNKGLDHNLGSATHDRGYAIDISCDKVHQIYLFSLYLKNVTKHHIAISAHNYHVHIGLS